MTEQNIEALDDGIIFKNNDHNVQPSILLIDNSVRGYVYDIYDLWSHQTFRNLHKTLEPN